MLAQLYHLHLNPYEEDLAFWLNLADQQGGPVLELGCGTGRVLLRLADSGYPVCGLDNDADMIAVLEARLEEGDYGEVEVHEADMTHFRINKRFPLIIIPCNTYSTLTTEGRMGTLESATRHLSPGGVLAASLPNPNWMVQLPEEADPEIETVFTHPYSGHPVQVSSAWQRNAEEVCVVMHYDHLLPDGRVDRISFSARHHLTTYELYLEEFGERGFKVRAYGDFEGTPYDSQSVYLIFVATIL